MSQILFTGSAQQNALAITAAAGVNLSAIQTGYVICVAAGTYIDTFEASGPPVGQTIPLKSAYNGPTSSTISTAACLSYLPDGTPLLEPGDTEIWPLWNRLARKVYASLATIPQPGTTAGTYAAGNDPRFSWATVVVGQTLSTSAAANTANLQAAINALPTTGGRIAFAQPGPILLTPGISLGGRAIVLQGAGLANPLVNTGAADLFVGDASDSIFADLAFDTNVTNPTAGAYLHLNHFYRSKLFRCNFADGWSHVVIDNGSAWAISSCVSSEAVKFGFDLANLESPDNGDNAMSDLWIGTSHSAGAGTAAIRYRSGGGLKMNNVKVNGGETTATQFAYGVLQDLIPGTGSSVWIVRGGSIENVSAAGIYQNNGIAGQANFSKVVIGGIEFFNMPLAMGLGQLTSGSGNGNSSLLIEPNVITNCGTAIKVDYWRNGHIATQVTENVNHIVVLGPSTEGIAVDRQFRYCLQNGAALNGYTIETTQPGADSLNLADFSTRCVQGVFQYPNKQVMFRLGLNIYSGCVVRVMATGCMAGHGAIHTVMTRSLYRGSDGAVTVTTIGTDINEGGAASVLTMEWDAATTSGEVRITHQLSVAQGMSVNYDVKVDGPLTFLKYGA